MLSLYEAPKDRVPSLVYICQRVAANHAESISNLGSELSFGLVKPILERCSADQLMRLEEASPRLQDDTPGIWKGMCFQKFRLVAGEHYSVDDEPQGPDSWKNRYFFLEEAEIKRFEEVGSKIRSQRLEADERKREREVKFTDRVPPPKRHRTGGWGVPAQPKTLFQKTRTEASKLQKSIYNSRVLPPRQIGKANRVRAAHDDSIIPTISNSTIPNRVTVNTITVPRRIPPSSSTSSSSPASTSSMPSPCPSSLSSFDMGYSLAHPSPKFKPSSVPPRMQNVEFSGSSPHKTSPASPSNSLTGPPPKSPAHLKKDPMASLFVPKHRAYSQKPVS